MGREATCRCKWGEEEGDCKVLLEGSELIFRLAIRRRVSLSSLANISTRGGSLLFRVGHDRVQMDLSPEAAERWAKAIATPPPSLAGKLGISSTTRLLVIGKAEAQELSAAVAEAGAVVKKEANLILICANSQPEIDHALDQCFEGKTCSASLWIIHPKGAPSGIDGSALRDLLRHRGYVDTKIASVSATLTAIRFNPRKAQTESKVPGRVPHVRPRVLRTFL